MSLTACPRVRQTTQGVPSSFETVNGGAEEKQLLTLSTSLHTRSHNTLVFNCRYSNTRTLHKCLRHSLDQIHIDEIKGLSRKRFGARLSTLNFNVWSYSISNYNSRLCMDRMASYHQWGHLSSPGPCGGHAQVENLPNVWPALKHVGHAQSNQWGHLSSLLKAQDHVFGHAQDKTRQHTFMNG